MDTPVVKVEPQLTSETSREAMRIIKQEMKCCCDPFSQTALKRGKHSQLVSTRELAGNHQPLEGRVLLADVEKRNSSKPEVEGTTGKKEKLPQCVKLSNGVAHKKGFDTRDGNSWSNPKIQGKAKVTMLVSA